MLIIEVDGCPILDTEVTSKYDSNTTLFLINSENESYTPTKSKDQFEAKVAEIAKIVDEISRVDRCQIEYETQG